MTAIIDSVSGDISVLSCYCGVGLCGFPLSLHKMSRWSAKFGHDHLLLNPFKFITYPIIQYHTDHTDRLTDGITKPQIHELCINSADDKNIIK
jgi:hypothetical protein